MSRAAAEGRTACGPSIRPRISVIVAARNAASTIEKTVQSLRDQSMRAWEAIVVDDGSTDRTADIIAGFQERDSRIRLIRQETQGVSRARNTGLSAARADWILFLDADDWIAKNLFKRVFRVLAKAPSADAALCPSLRVADDRIISPAYFTPSLETTPFETFARYCAADIHSIVLRRQVALDAGGFDPELKTNEDWDLWVRVARTGASFVTVPRTAVFYRLRADSASANQAQMIADARKVIARIGGPDSRVKYADPRYAAGMRGACGTELLAIHALWYATVRAGNGRSGLSALDLIEALPDFKLKHDDLVSSMHYALIWGSRTSKWDLIDNWPRFEPFVLEICERLQASSSQKTLANALMDKLIRQILKTSRLSASLTAWRLHARRLDLRLPLQEIRAPPNVDRLFLKLRYGRLPAGEILIPYCGPIPPSELARMALEKWGLLRFASLRWLARWSGVACTIAHSSAKSAFALLTARWERRRHLAGIAHGIAHGFAAPALFKILERAGPGSLGKPQAPAEAARIIERARVQAMSQDVAAGESREARGGRRAAWDGASCSRVEAPLRGVTRHVPILMYHRVAEDCVPALKRYCVHPRDFEQQLRFLRRNGYYALSPSMLLEAIRSRQPLPGRPIMLTFDDAYKEFRETAWPLLEMHNFGAEVFVVTAKVGATADWDSEYGAPAALMSWDDIAELSARGVRFGSHLATHASADGLLTDELISEAASSRFSLETRLKTEVRAIALPYGAHDDRIVFALQWCGYQLGFTTGNAVSSIYMDPMRLPRVEITNTDDLVAFAGKLRPAGPLGKSRR